MKYHWLDKEDEYYVRTMYVGYERVDGKPVQIPPYGEMDFFVCLRPCGYAVFLGVIGILLANDGRKPGTPSSPKDYYSTPEEAIERTSKGMMNSTTTDWREYIEYLISTFGLSPRYRWEEMEES